MNLWGQATKKQYPAQPLRKAYSNNEAHKGHNPTSIKKDPLSINRVGPVGDHWATSNDSKMETYSLHVSDTELTRLQSKICGKKDHQQIPPFESICTVVWQCIAKAKHGLDVKVVTMCKRDPNGSYKGLITNNAQIIKVVKTDCSVEESSPMELGLLIMNQGVDDRRNIEEAMEPENELPDFLVYGANLTFVDLCDIPLYELDIRGQTPVDVNCVIDNIGDEGVVLVYASRKDRSEGLIVSITLPEKHMPEVKSVLKNEWSLVRS